MLSHRQFLNRCFSLSLHEACLEDWLGVGAALLERTKGNGLISYQGEVKHTSQRAMCLRGTESPSVSSQPQAVN